MKLVSVIIPVYNRFNVLKRTLESVFNQTYTHWELIVVDDGSKDVLDIHRLGLENIPVDRCTIVRNEPNIGPGLSRQRGLEMAKGDYVCFLDADDTWANTFLEKSVHKNELHPEVAATYCMVEETWADGVRIRKNSDKAVEHIFPENVSGGCPWQTSCLMWKKAYTGHWTDLRTTQDRVFEFHCACIRNKVVYIPEKLCFVDKSTGGNSADLVNYERSLAHRHIHTVYFLQNVGKVKHDTLSQQQITHLLEKNLLKNTLRLVIHRHEDDKITEALKILFHKFKRSFYTRFYRIAKGKFHFLNPVLVRMLQIEFKFR